MMKKSVFHKLIRRFKAQMSEWAIPSNDMHHKIQQTPQFKKSNRIGMSSSVQHASWGPSATA